MHKISLWLLAIVVCLVLTSGGSDQLRAEIPEDALSIGEASLVVPNVSGRIGEVTRTINVEDNVFSDEVINTADRGATRIVFKDRTELTVGANSSVVLDQFIYDPNAGAGSLVVNLLKGVFEFNSGDMASEAYRLNTPSATLAIRGTSFTVMITPGQTPGTYDLTVSVTDGRVDIEYDNGIQFVSVGAGEMVIIHDLPLPQFASTGGTDAEITVESCSDSACLEAAFAAANAAIVEDLILVIALANDSIEPQAGDGALTEPQAGNEGSTLGSTLPNTLIDGGGGGGGCSGGVSVC